VRGPPDESRSRHDSDGRRGRRFTVDGRGRVPFALVGVLLLVTSAAHAGGLAAQGPVTEDRSVERALDRAEADAADALRVAAADAAREAAREPVTRATADGAGGAVRPESAFRDALRVRIYLAVERSLPAAEARHGDVTAVASLPAVESVDDLPAARDGIGIDPVANGTALRVTARNVTVRATRDGRTVARRTVNLTATVAVPVLAAHDRTERFEQRLNRSPLEGPGLGRRLTARLYPVAWARGGVQYRGGPVGNVLASRHVALSANAALLREQRAAFGAADPAGRRGLRRATERTLLDDTLAPTPIDEAWTDVVLPPPGGGESPDTVQRGGPIATPVSVADRPAEGRSVAVNRSADAAFREVATDLDPLLRDGYRVEATLEVDARRTRTGPRPPDPDGDGWRLVDETVRTDSTVEGDGGDVGFGTAVRTVTVDYRMSYKWRTENATALTSASGTDRYRVAVTVDGAYAPAADAPDRPVDPLYEPGGALDGPNLDGVPADARAALDAEDVDELAVRAAEEGSVSRERTLTGDRPDRLRLWVYEDVRELRETVRRIAVRVPAGEIAAGRANPPAALAAAIRERREALIDPPATYDGAADRTRVAVRAAYVDAVIAVLEERAERVAATDESYADALSAAGIPDAGRLGAVMDARREASPTEPYAVGGSGPGGSVALEPRASPGYLPRTAVDGDRVRGLPEGTTARPLATRNLNAFTVPYDSAADRIVDRLLGEPDRVRLATAGRALIAANRTLDRVDSPELRARRDELVAAVAAALDHVDAAATDTLAADAEARAERADEGTDRRNGTRTRTGNGPASDRGRPSSTATLDGPAAVGERSPDDTDDHAAAVERAGDRYDSLGERAVAVGDGRYAGAVAAEAADERNLTDDEADLLAVKLRIEIDRVRGGEARLPREDVNATVGATRRIARGMLSDAVEDGLGRVGSRAAQRWATEPIRAVGAGLPVTPVPGYWYATVNVWYVEVHGVYPRFTLRADAGPPGDGFRYVRSNATATVTVDGRPVVLGRAEPVRFETATVVVVAVPPGPPGVGDVSGGRDERSGGWPCPAPEAGGCDR